MAASNHFNPLRSLGEVQTPPPLGNTYAMPMKFCHGEKNFVATIFYNWPLSMSKLFMSKACYNLQSRICWKNNEQGMSCQGLTLV